MKNKTIDILFYIVVASPFYIMFYLGLIAYYPQINYFTTINYGYSYGPSWYIPNGQTAPFFIIGGLIGIGALFYRSIIRRKK